MPEFHTSRNGILTIPTGEKFVRNPFKAVPSATFVSAPTAFATSATTTTVSGLAAVAGDIIIMMVSSLYDPKAGAKQGLPTGFTTIQSFGPTGDFGAYIGSYIAPGAVTSLTTIAGTSVFYSSVTTIVLRGPTTVRGFATRGMDAASESIFQPQFTTAPFATANDSCTQAVFMSHRAATNAYTNPSELANRAAIGNGVNMYITAANGATSTNGYAPLYTCTGSLPTLVPWMAAAVFLT